MHSKAPDELREFHCFVGEKIGSGDNALSPEEVLDQWRSLHPPADSSAEDMAAIEEVLDDMNKGDVGVPFADFDREFRAKHGLPAQV